MPEEVITSVATPENVAPIETQEDVKVTEPKPVKTFTQEELDAKIQKRLAKEAAKAEEDRKEKEYWRKLALEKDKSEVRMPSPDSEPKRNQYETYEEFLEAKSDYKAGLRVAKELEKRDREREAERIAEEQNRVLTNFHKQTQEAASKYDDYEEVINESTAQISEVMGKEIIESDLGAELTYYFAKNPKEADRIRALEPRRQVKEIGKLELKLESSKEEPKEEPKPKKLSSAPEPITPIGGKGAPISDLPSPKDDMATWLKKRNAQLERARR